MPWNEGREITVGEVQALAGRLGIPHFQRGLVWGPDTIAALLESLFYKTPCGSFVFWKPDPKSPHGIPLLGNTPTDIDYFIIDGQQRIRSLYSVSEDEPIWETHTSEAATDQDLPAGPGRKRVWCVNLTRVDGFSGVLKAHGKEYSLFLFAVDPLHADKRSPLRTNILPLHLFKAHETWETLTDYHKCVVPRDGGFSSSPDLAEPYLGLRERILGIRRETFFVSTIRTNNVAEVVALYNRINSGGKRVEIEERAFAMLVASQPATWPRLADLFATVHCHDPQIEAVQRDDVLRRGQERSFGFKLFIRVFLQVCHHHFGYSMGRNSFSFDIAKKDSFRRRLAGLAEAEACLLWDETKEVLTLVSTLLRSPLSCDDFRFLPDTQDLTPLIQLLVSYPGLRGNKFHPIIASLCLRFFLAQLDPKTLAMAVSQAADPDKNAFAVIPPLLKHADAKIEKDLAKHLESASSIQDRYVLLLYWLVRHNGAQDFSYDNIRHPRRPTHPPVSIDATAKPEKQHMVPFSRLVRALKDEDAQRGGTHRFNNIGNLTYISREMNSYETGLGDEIATLRGEPEANLHAHLLCAPASGSKGTDPYQQLLRLLRDDAPPPEPATVNAVFDRFCAQRRKRIHEGFRAWLEDLDRAACAAVGLQELTELPRLANGRDRVEPQRPRFVDEQHLEASHLIRGLDLDNEVESLLIQLASRNRKGVRLKAGLLTIRLTKGRFVRLEASTHRLELRLDAHLAPQHRALVSKFLGLKDLDVPLLEAGRAQMAAMEKLPGLAEEVCHIEDQISAAAAETIAGKGGPGRKSRRWTEAQFLAGVEAKQRPGKPTRQLVKSLIRFGLELEPQSDPFRSPSREGSAIVNIGDIGLFTLYPEDLYIRLLRNLNKPGAPETEAEWEVVIQRLNACGLGVFSKRDLGHARIVEKRLSGMTEDDVARFKDCVKWFASSVNNRVATR